MTAFSSTETSVEKSTMETDVSKQTKTASRDFVSMAKMRLPAQTKTTTSPPPSGHRQRVYPWCLLPDAFWKFLGFGQLVLAVPAIMFIVGMRVMDKNLYPSIIQPLLQRVGKQLSIPANTVPNFIDRVSRSVAKKIMRDPRNYAYLPWMLWINTVTPAAFIYSMYHYNTYVKVADGALFGIPFLPSWSTFAARFLGLFLVYHFLRLGPRFRFFAYHHVICHKECHELKSFFKGGWLGTPASWIENNVYMKNLNQVTGHIFYGAIPFVFRTAHIKFHHFNEYSDFTTNIDLDRSDTSGFILYLPRFSLYYSGLSCVYMFLRKGDMKSARLLLCGIAIYLTKLSICVALTDWLFAYFFIIYPFIEGTAFMACMNYLWHMCYNPENPECEYTNSITLLEGQDNIFNEDYHAIHHYAPQIHWQDVPAEFERNKEKYRAAKATIFRDTEEGQLAMWLIKGDFDQLAEHFVDLDGKMTFEEKKQLLLERTRWTYVPRTE